MKKTLKRVLSVSLMATFATSLFLSGQSGSWVKSALGEENALFTDVTGKVDLSSIAEKNLAASVEANRKSYETRTVIVSLEGDTLIDAANGGDISEYAVSSEGKKKAQVLENSQDAFLKRLSEKGISYKLENRYTAIDNGLALELNTKYVSTIKEMKGVRSVYIAQDYNYPETTSADSRSSAVTNETSVYKTGVYDSSSVMEEYGYTGDGSVVAIVDTGLDYTHDAFRVYDEYPMDSAALSKDDVSKALQSSACLASQRTAANGEKLDVNDVYLSKKVPFAYDYADNDADVYPSYSNHGTHVAGIVAGYDPNGYTDKDGNHISDAFMGVAPEAQLVICKVFTDNLEDESIGGAETENILAALEDCVLLGVDVINMSLGTSCGFSTTDDGDDEGEELNRVYNKIREAGVSLVCAASNDYSASYGGNFGTNLASNPDSGTVGSPSVYAAALSVASISGKQSPYMLANAGTDSETTVFYEESSNQDNQYYDFAKLMLGENDSQEFEYVSVPGVGRVSDYSVSIRNKFKSGNRIALVKRGDISFKDKVEIAKSMGAKAIIVYNNVAGTIRMSLGEVEDPIPSASISMDAGNSLVAYAAAHDRIGKIKIDNTLLAGPFMSEFSSWGPTPDLKLKPEVTAHGGEITSAVPGGYDEMSGTSMASPNMAGVVAMIRSYLKETQANLTTQELNQRINQLVMSTATIVYDREGLPYSPRKQGAGLGSLENAISSRAYLSTSSEEIDYRPKVDLGDDKQKKGVYEVEFEVNNFGDSALEFNVKPIFMTETLSSDGFAVAEQAYLLDDIAPTWTVSGGSKNGDVLTVAAGGKATVKVTLTLSDAEKNYIDSSFKNGMYVEGFIKLESRTAGQCDMTLPYMGFYGDWSAAPMLDYDAYEIDASLQDSSVDDEDKLKASVWATQPYTTYYNNKYSMPMGTFAYLQDESADRVYTVEEHNAVSCYNNYYGENNGSNYLTAYRFRGLYVGLLRGARTVKYNLKNAETGEVLYESTANRIGKAYTSGNSTGTPAYVKFELEPMDYNLVSNGKYTMEFEFYLDYDNGEGSVKNTYSFSFYADYDAPVLQDARVRYYDYKDGNQDKQRIYLDLDVYDNHYAQSALLCYYDGTELKQVNDYVTPIYNSVKNGTNTVSIDITDIYDDYKDRLYLQIDDYALNHSVYYLNLNNRSAQMLPDSFELAEGEENLSLDVYGTHKVALKYDGSANLSNFEWSSADRSVADVRNGEIVGLKTGSTKITVSNGKGVYKTINVTVGENVGKLNVPSLSFGVIADGEDNLVEASGSVSVYPDQSIQLKVLTDPWYYPKDSIKLLWESGNTDIATVDQEGNLDLKKKGTATIKATLYDVNGNLTAYAATVIVRVQDPFVVSNYQLTEYRGKDSIVEIPTDRNIMYIDDEAFKDNTTMTEVIIPKSVMAINQEAFYNCTALKHVYVVSREKQPIADSDLKLIYRYAFYGCTALETVDLSNVKVVTLDREVFNGCTNLKEIVNMSAIGTAGDQAFMGCTALESVDLSGLHVSGQEVFRDCTKLAVVETDKYTAIGRAMFRNCTALRSIVLKNTSVGESAFEGCTALTSVRIEQTEKEYEIDADAFRDSGLATLTYSADTRIRVIGDRAFANTKLSLFTVPEGLEEWGENVFLGTNTLKSVSLPASFDMKNIKLAGAMFKGLNVTIAENPDYTIEDGVLYNADKTVLYSVLDDKTSLTIPASVTEIYDYAFANSRIARITIPATVKKIGEGAFKNSYLSGITFESGSAIEEIAAEAFRGSRLTAIELPSSVKSIGESAFTQTLLGSIDLSGVTSIGANAFENCSYLKTVTIDESVKTIGSYAFRNCSALTSITLPAVTSMGMSVFSNASALTQVVFGNEATTIGDYTFYGANSLRSVTFGNGIKEIGAYAFYNCTNLNEVDLGGVKSIDAYAFANCTRLSDIDLSNVETIGELAFYNNNSLTKLTLTSVKSVARGAFAIDNGRGGATTVSFPVIETIGVMAFEGSDLTSVEIPATVTSIGYAAFANIEGLSEYKVAEGNTAYFVEDGVLYRNTPSGDYELIAYPSAEETRTEYTVIDGTVRVEAYAFFSLNGNLKKVTLPYSLVALGDAAFYNSGITEYTFESINAPALESVYREATESVLQQYVDSNNPMENPAINSFYYCNFDSMFVYYTDLVNQKSTLIINYPTNGVGYDNYVYTRYFGTKNTTGIHMDDYTREFLNMVDGFVSDETINTWSAAAKNGDTTTYRAAVEAFSDTVKNARLYYNNITDETQLSYISAAYVEKLEKTENALRDVKKAYGVTVTISTLRYEQGSYKDTYTEGETFDMTGLKITVVYDDGSMETAPASRLKLLTTRALNRYDRTVDVQYTDENGNVYDMIVGITVTASKAASAKTDNNAGTTDNNLANATLTNKGVNVGNIVLILTTVIVTLGGIVAVAYVIRRKKS